MTTLYLEHYPLGDISVKIVYISLNKIILDCTGYKHEIVPSKIKVKVDQYLYKWSKTGDTITVNKYKESGFLSPSNNVTINVYTYKKRYNYKLDAVVRID